MFIRFAFTCPSLICPLNHLYVIEVISVFAFVVSNIRPFLFLLTPYHPQLRIMHIEIILVVFSLITVCPPFQFSHDPPAYNHPSLLELLHLSSLCLTCMR